MRAGVLQVIFNEIDSLCFFQSDGQIVLSFTHCTEVRFASFRSCGFTNLAVINPPEKKLEKCTSLQCMKFDKNFDQKYSFEAL